MRGLVHTVNGDLVIATIHRKEACGECRACLSGMTKTEMEKKNDNRKEYLVTYSNLL